MRGEGSQLSLRTTKLLTYKTTYFANYKRRKKTQAKQIEAIREVTPGTKRPEVNRDEELSNDPIPLCLHFTEVK